MPALQLDRPLLTMDIPDDSDSIEIDDHCISLLGYRKRLKVWGQEHMRSYPWRFTRDPYHVLMAEYMLIRTQAVQVLPVYRQFVQRYSSLDELAEASRSEVREILSPLGLQWRADCVYDSAQIMSEKYGRVPTEKEALLDLPGVSQYVAGAVRCLVRNSSEALIDTNTVRIAGRLFDLEIKPSSRRSRRYKRLIERLLDPDAPRLYNLSMLDLGALVCTSRSPSCDRCPLSVMCRYGHRLLNKTARR